MKKTVLLISLIIIFLVILITMILWKFSDELLSFQYNSNGISHYLVITIDKNQSKEYLGTLDNHKVYIEHLNIKETNFRTVDAKNMSIKEAIEKKLVSIKEWEKYAWKVKKENDNKILYFENYKIVITKDDCIIKPLK